MSSGEVTNIVIGVAVVALLLARHMQTRARERSSARIILILAIVGVFDISDATKGHTLGAGAVAWLIGSLLVGGGVVYALTAVGRDRVISSFVNFGADVMAPGRIMQGNVATFRVGELDGVAEPRAEASVRLVVVRARSGHSLLETGQSLPRHLVADDRKLSTRCCQRIGFPGEADRRNAYLCSW